jgi:PadR family transcriptional regulator, regulatory protein PadR
VPEGTATAEWGDLLLTFGRTDTSFLLSSGRKQLAKPSGSEQVLQGTLDLLILKTLSLAPMHGWGLTHRIEQLSQDALQVGQGSIYPALVRLEQRGWIDTEWRVTENSRRAKYYRLTAAGRRALGNEVASWQRFVRAVGLVLAAES